MCGWDGRAGCDDRHSAKAECLQGSAEEGVRGSPAGTAGWSVDHVWAALMVHRLELYALCVCGPPFFGENRPALSCLAIPLASSSGACRSSPGSHTSHGLEYEGDASPHTGELRQHALAHL